MLSHDYSNLFKDSCTQSNYFNFSTYLRTYLFIIFTVAVDHNIARLTLLLLINSIYIVYLLTFQPFNIRFNNLRHITLELFL